jgi:hypothetical protein
MTEYLFFAGAEGESNYRDLASLDRVVEKKEAILAASTLACHDLQNQYCEATIGLTIELDSQVVAGRWCGGMTLASEHSNITQGTFHMAFAFESTSVPTSELPQALTYLTHTASRAAFHILKTLMNGRKVYHATSKNDPGPTDSIKPR